jgi:glycosyltransferase involved in cell wall biosynthesis
MTKNGNGKLAVVTDLMAPYRVPLFNALAEKIGARLHVFFMGARADNRPWESAALDARFDYTILKGKDLSPASSTGFNHFWNPGMFRALSRFSPDVIVIGGYHHPTSYAALAFARLKRRKLVLWSESTALDARPSSAVRATIKKMFINSCDAFLVPGVASRDYLLTLGVNEDDIYRSQNSIDVQRFEELSAPFRTPQARREFRELHGLPEFLLLFVGRLSHEKGFPVLVEVAARLQKKGKNVGMMVVGDGDKRDEYLKASTELQDGSALFVGFVQQPQLPLYYAQADALVLPSRSEPWGLVLNEAMACGLPVLCSRNVGASYDLITDGENGFVCSTVDEYEARIDELISSPERHSDISQRALERARKFTPDAAAEGFRVMLSSLTQSGEAA